MSDLYNLRIQFYFEPRDGLQHAPDGPGWYLAATRTNGDPETQEVYEVVPRVRLSKDDMIKISKVLDKFVHGKPLNWASSPHIKRDDVSLEQAVLEAFQAGKEKLHRQLEAAERAAAQVDRLRKRAEEFDATE